MRVHRLLLLMVSCLFILMGCSEEQPLSIPIDQNHQQYVESFGWHIEKYVKQHKRSKGYFKKEYIISLQQAGADLASYQDDVILETIYLLSEKHEKGEIEVSVYEVDSKIVGAVLHLKPFEPGLRRIDECEKIVVNP